MDFSALLLIGFLWFVFNLMRGAAKAGSGGKRPPTGNGSPTRPPQSHPHPLTAPSGADPTQREGSRLEALLRDLNRSLEDAARVKTDASEEPARPPVARKRAGDAASLEVEVRRPSRAAVDQDEMAEQAAAARIAAVEARNTRTAAADHPDFDRRIRQEPADHTAVRTYSAQQLRDAVVWREILGPPVALREEPGSADRG